MKKSFADKAKSLLMRGNSPEGQMAPIITDPNGSYTGRPTDPEERPIQDADDL